MQLSHLFAYRRFKYIVLALTLLYIALITWLSLATFESDPNMVSLPGLDKVAHLCFYFGLNTLLLTLSKAYGAKLDWRGVVLISSVSISYSILIEMIQPHFDRECDLYDALFNTIGALLSLSLLRYLRMR